MTQKRRISVFQRLKFSIEHRLKQLKQRPPKQDTSISAQTAMPTEEVGDPRIFVPSDYGSGAFGRWIVDENGLPAYAYEMNQYTDSRARYPTTNHGYSRDHWHQLGNSRITGLAHNDGVVQVYIGDRGGTILNHYEAGEVRGILGMIWEIMEVIFYAPIRWLQIQLMPKELRPYHDPGLFKRLRMAVSSRNIDGYLAAAHAYVGGYGYIYDGKEAWATAYRYLPSPLEKPPERIFGIGYFKTTAQYHNLRVTRWTYAPAGDVPAMLMDILIENLESADKNLCYYEYWDVNVYQLVVQLFRTGVAGPIGDADRRELNLQFTTDIQWDDQAKAIRFCQKPPPTAPPPSKADEVNWYPADVFLADLSGVPASAYVDKEKFFGKGGARQPTAIVNQQNGEVKPIPDSLMPYCMVLRRDLHLEPGETIRLRYAYGAVNAGETLDFLNPYRYGDPLADMLVSWKQQLAYFSTGNLPALQREVAWNAYYLLSSTVFNEFYKTHITPQGSAYLYLHGSDGAPRDHALFCLTLTYLAPHLARDALRLIMGITDSKTGQINYAFAGYGIVGGAGIHNHPSDLDLFFLWALTEYVTATGDVDFLYEDVPFYPTEGYQPDDITVLNHVRVAVAHLLNDVGLGDDDLIRICDGDWSDGIVLENVLKFPPQVSFTNSFKYGESIPNSQMALYVLPRVHNLIAAQPTQAAQDLALWIQNQIHPIIPRLKNGISKQWTGQWYTRAILRSRWRNRKIALYAKTINLEAQVWALINELETYNILANSIYSLLDEDSPNGAPTMQRSEIWPAISQLLTWGYSRRRPELAWRSLLNNTFAAHAAAFPDIWFGIWSGPDGTSSIAAKKNPGGTWASPVTPMTDFPVMNNNPHSMTLFALLRVCGIEPTESGDGLRIAPQIPDRYRLDLPLLSLDVKPGSIQVEYRAAVDGTRAFYIRIAENAQNVAANMGDQPCELELRDQFAVFRLTFTAGQKTSMSVRWD